MNVSRVKSLVLRIDSTTKKLKVLKDELRSAIMGSGERAVRVAVETPRKRKMTLAWRRAIGRGISKAHKQRMHRLTVPVVPEQ